MSEDQIHTSQQAAPAHKWHHPHRWGSVIIGFIAFSVIGATATVTLKDRVMGEAAAQPIEFNHKLHVEDNDLGCATCHQYYEKEAFSGLPDAEVCAFCHSEKQGESQEEARLAEMINEGSAVQWTPLFNQPPHVYYSHQRHVVAGKLECKICHGDIAGTTVPPQRVVKLRMEDCIDCHQRKSVSTDCTTCHR